MFIETNPTTFYILPIIFIIVEKFDQNMLHTGHIIKQDHLFWDKRSRSFCTIPNIPLTFYSLSFFNFDIIFSYFLSFYHSNKELESLTQNIDHELF